MNCMEVWGGNCSAEKSFAMPGLDVWIWSRRRGRSEVDGGDVHFLSSCASGRITRMFLADICGRGSVFVELASELRNLMMHNVNVIKQRRFVQDIHRRLQDFSDRDGFGTALISTFFAPTKSFALCNAGHPPPLVFRAAEAKWSVLKQIPTDGFCTDPSPLGVLDQGEYQQLETHLENGDMVMSYSNVLTECRDSRGNFLGVDGLSQLFQEIDPARPSETVAKLISRIESVNPDDLTENDVTVLLCRAVERNVGWRNNLFAPFRLLRKVANNTRLE